MNKQKQWSVFMQTRFQNRGAQQYYKASSIWSEISDVLQQLKLDVFWNIGSSSQCRTWFDDWTSVGPL